MSLLKSWQGPPLLTPKVVTLLRLLESDRQRCIKENLAAQQNCNSNDSQSDVGEGRGAGAAGADADPWGGMVFVETKVCCQTWCATCMALLCVPSPQGALHWWL